jgi:hypothetical protein
MQDTQPMGQRDVRQRNKIEGMMPQTANRNGLVDASKDSHDFILLLDDRGNIAYAKHSTRRLPQNAQQYYLNGPYSGIGIKPKNDRYSRLVTREPYNKYCYTCSQTS